MPGDLEVGAASAGGSGLPVDDQDWILEGGGIDVDGAGLCVTTEECLLNLNRNPTLTREDIAVRLHQSLGIERLLWLGNGLVGVHTDGHVDNLDRFVADGRLALPVTAVQDDPHAHKHTTSRVEHGQDGGGETLRRYGRRAESGTG